MRPSCFLTVFALCLFSLSVSAQKTKDVLYLKNGSIIYGKLVEAGSESFKLKTADGSLMIYPSQEVEKLTREVPVFDGRKKNGFSFALESGVLVGSQNTQYKAPFSFGILAGGVIDTHHSISAGTGIEFIERPFTPIFAEYKYIIRNSRTSPFLFMRAGGIVPFGGDNSSGPANYYGYGEKDYKGGGLIAIGTGLSWARDGYETYLSFAYRHSKTSYSRYESPRGTTTYSNDMNRLEIKFGFKF